MIGPLVAVIPAAGRGTRAYPYTRGIPKGMLEVDGQPNLERLIALLRKQMGIEEMVVVTGRYGEAIERHFGDGSRHGVRLVTVRNDRVERGLSHSLLLARPHVGERFVVVLADELYLDSNHAGLLWLDWSDALAVVGVRPEPDPGLVRKNYGVVAKDGVVKSLVEKPRHPESAMLGVGTFLFHRRIFDHLEAALAPGAPRPNDPVSVLARACAGGERILAFPLTGDYVNINDRDGLNLANTLVRSRRFEERSVGVAVLHRASIAETLATAAGFRARPRVTEVRLVLPPGTDAPGVPVSDLAFAPSAEQGDMLRAGLDALGTDLLLTTYGDGSFSPRDLPKFLEYLKDADLVTGTRTTRQLVDQGTNMRGLVRLAHVLLAKALELVWWGYEPRLTDVGCAYRGIWASTWRLIRPRVLDRGPAAWAEVLIETLACRRRVVEIPVSFHLREKGLREKEQTLRTAAAILALILRRRVARS